LSKVRSGELSESVEIQLDEGRDYCQRQGWNVAGEFKDDDISASKYSKKLREDYDNLLNAIRGNQGDVVVITEMPRLYRRLEELLELIHLAETTSLRKIATTDDSGYNLSTGEGIHNAISAVNNAARESSRISERTKRLKRAGAKAGKPNGGRRCYGFESDGETMREAEAVVIREMVRRLLDGETQTGLVRDLNQRGIPTCDGKTWTPKTVRMLLFSKRLIGIRTHLGMEYKATWPAIIAGQDWEKVQLILRANAQLAPPVKARHYLLTGLVECGTCGKPMRGSLYRWGKDKVAARYRCLKQNVAGLPYGCGKIMRNSDPVDFVVTEAVLKRYESSQFAKALHQAEHGDELRELLNEQHADKLRLQEIREAYAGGKVGLEDMLSIKGMIEDALEETRTKLTRVSSRRLLGSIPVGATIRDAWAAADLQWRRNFLKLLVKKVVLLPSVGRRPRFEKWQFDPSRVRIVWCA
jgi:DNA invertase Pin-like site-specific DNA recombinase